MRKRKQTREERNQRLGTPKEEQTSKPITKEDLEELFKHFGQTKNLPK